MAEIIQTACGRRWPEPETLGAYPAPEHSSRDETPETAQYPSAVLKLAERAREAGWEVRQQYARGSFPHAATGRPGAVKDSYALIFGRHPMTDRRAYAIYCGNAWKSVCVYGPGLPPFLGAGITDLTEFLLMPDATDEIISGWIAAIRNRRAQQEAAKKTAQRVSRRRSESGG